MNFLKKLFQNKENKPKAMSHFNKYREELNDLELKTFSDLENLVKPLIRTATKLEVLPASRPPENSQMVSHFGGNPYFEKGESWPKTDNGNHLAFIFQIFNTPELELPESIALVQFYYDWEEFPWETSSEGWLVKIYKKVNQDMVGFIATPSTLETAKYCLINCSATNSLPDWEGIDLHSPPASKLSCALDENEPWDSYDQVVEKLIGEQDYLSQLGGYPKWVQGEETPNDSNGNPMKLLFQIDSEDNAGLMWGDVGLIYVFYDESSEKIEFTLQCH